MATWVQTAVDDETLWELGLERQCIRTDIHCRFEPCTLASGVRCCADCMMCGNPCPIAKGGAR